jgi:site-specific recombinase XerD
VQALAGHLHLTTTQRYAHVVQRDLTKATNQFGQKWGSKPPERVDE